MRMQARAAPPAHAAALSHLNQWAASYEAKFPFYKRLVAGEPLEIVTDLLLGLGTLGSGGKGVIREVWLQHALAACKTPKVSPAVTVSIEY